jgi:hypothetical protein
MDYKKLQSHIHHEIKIVGYGKCEISRNKQTGEIIRDYDNIALECEDCNEVIISFNNPKN